MKKICETARLYLREFIETDAPFIVTLTNSSGWLQYIGDRNTKTEKLAIDYLNNGPIKSYKENGFGLWMVALKQNDLPIGMCGIIRRANYPQPDIGFAYLPEYCGKGYAFEAAQATMEYAKEKLQLSTVVAMVMPENNASIKLLERIGMHSCGSFSLNEGDKPLLLYKSEL